MISALLVLLLLCEGGLAVIGGLAWSTLHEEGGIAALVLMGASGAAGVVLMLVLLLRRKGSLGSALAWLRLLGVFVAGAVLVAVGELSPAAAALLALFDSLLGVVLAGFVRRGR
ncbi:hypothetical protein OWR29_24490 [Actinoplanes sp. Pm04-4]|uniref:Uncharacterized protein n=1 Tax=Paractinoplanes pyxinae TaxID=2997416 RepID=A0ABT4B3W3_9ACTN|nr:hypothetical protein [Actinoplanes pyxinae]MCY1141170.1 hypothetical protein [Actinoplanes pyxinae]